MIHPAPPPTPTPYWCGATTHSIPAAAHRDDRHSVCRDASTPWRRPQEHSRRRCARVSHAPPRHSASGGVSPPRKRLKAEQRFVALRCSYRVTACPFVRSRRGGALHVGCVDRQLRGRSFTVIVWCIGWSDQGEVNMFRGDLRRAACGKQCVRKFLAAVGLREPPRGGIDQGKALHRR